MGSYSYVKGSFARPRLTRSSSCSQALCLSSKTRCLEAAPRTMTASLQTLRYLAKHPQPLEMATDTEAPIGSWSLRDVAMSVTSLAAFLQKVRRRRGRRNPRRRNHWTAAAVAAAASPSPSRPPLALDAATFALIAVAGLQQRQVIRSLRQQNSISILRVEHRRGARSSGTRRCARIGTGRHAWPASLPYRRMVEVGPRPLPWFHRRRGVWLERRCVASSSSVFAPAGHAPHHCQYAGLRECWYAEALNMTTDDQ